MKERCHADSRLEDLAFKINVIFALILLISGYIGQGISTASSNVTTMTAKKTTDNVNSCLPP